MRKLLPLFVLGLSGCASIDFDYPRVESTYLTETEDTYLAQKIAVTLAGRPQDNSGFLFLLDGIDALAARLRLAETAERSIDVQYYLIKQDTVGQVFLLSLLKAADRGVLSSVEAAQAAQACQWDDILNLKGQWDDIPAEIRLQQMTGHLKDTTAMISNQQALIKQLEHQLEQQAINKQLEEEGNKLAAETRHLQVASCYEKDITQMQNEIAQLLQDKNTLREERLLQREATLNEEQILGETCMDELQRSKRARKKSERDNKKCTDDLTEIINRRDDEISQLHANKERMDNEKSDFDDQLEQMAKHCSTVIGEAEKRLADSLADAQENSVSLAEARSALAARDEQLSHSTAVIDGLKAFMKDKQNESKDKLQKAKLFCLMQRKSSSAAISELRTELESAKESVRLCVESYNELLKRTNENEIKFQSTLQELSEKLSTAEEQREKLKQTAQLRAEKAFKKAARTEEERVEAVEQVSVLKQQLLVATEELASLKQQRGGPSESDAEGPTAISYAVVSEATDGFSQANWLGSGGQSSGVFKGGSCFYVPSRMFLSSCNALKLVKSCFSQ